MKRILLTLTTTLFCFVALSQNPHYTTVVNTNNLRALVDTLDVDSLTDFNADVRFLSTGYILIPVGTTGQRPTAVNGQIRYNTTLGKFEAYEAGTWKEVITGATGGSVGTNEIAYGDGSGGVTSSGNAKYTENAFANWIQVKPDDSKEDAYISFIDDFVGDNLEQAFLGVNNPNDPFGFHKPAFIQFTNDTATVSAVIYTQLVSDKDSGTTPLLAIGAEKSGAAVATRPIIAEYNYTTKLREVAADGTQDFQGNDLTVVNAVTNTSGDLTLTPNSSNHVNISAGGLEIAGTEFISSAGGLHVSDTSRFQGDATFTGDATFASGTTGAATVSISDETISDGESRNFRVEATHNSVSRLVQIGVYTHAGITNAAGYLSLDAADAARDYLWVDNNDDLRISTTVGNIGTTSGTVVGTQTSDIRLKDTTKFKYGLREILEIEPIKFTYKNDTEKVEHIGFSAQQVRPIIPESVYDTGEPIEGETETKLAMKYVEIVPVLVKAVQEQNELIKRLEARIKELESK